MSDAFKSTELHCTEGHAIQPKDREYVERLRDLLHEVLGVFSDDWNEMPVDSEWAQRANGLVKRIEQRLAARCGR